VQQRATGEAIVEDQVERNASLQVLELYEPDSPRGRNEDDEEEKEEENDQVLDTDQKQKKTAFYKMGKQTSNQRSKARFGISVFKDNQTISA
jgi:hypothetical protein